MTESELLTPAEVASTLKLTRQSIYGLIARGELPALRVSGGAKGSLRVARTDLADYLARANGADVSDWAAAAARQVQTR